MGVDRAQGSPPLFLKWGTIISMFPTFFFWISQNNYKITQYGGLVTLITEEYGTEIFI